DVLQVRSGPESASPNGSGVRGRMSRPVQPMGSALDRAERDSSLNGLAWLNLPRPSPILPARYTECFLCLSDPSGFRREPWAATEVSMFGRLARIPLLIAITTVLAVPARAQDGSRVQLEIQRTDDRIAQATTIVTGSGNERAESALANANSLQAAAKRAFDASQFPIALRNTMAARLR